MNKCQNTLQASLPLSQVSTHFPPFDSALATCTHLGVLTSFRGRALAFRQVPAHFRSQRGFIGRPLTRHRCISGCSILAIRFSCSEPFLLAVVQPRADPEHHGVVLRNPRGIPAVFSEARVAGANLNAPVYVAAAPHFEHDKVAHAERFEILCALGRRWPPVRRVQANRCAALRRLLFVSHFFHVKNGRRSLGGRRRRAWRRFP